MNIKVNRYFFELEAKRDFMAKNDKLVALKKTYASTFGTPMDINNKRFWNKKIKDKKSEILQSPIYLDKIFKISNLLNTKNGLILDVGMGYGSLEEKLQANKNLRLYGIDISDQAIKNAKKRFNGKFVVGSVFKIPFNSRMFDFVVALDILEHIPANKIFLVYKELSRVLKVGGTLIVSVPINEHLEKMFAMGENPNGHLRVYTPELIMAELKIKNFNITSSTLLFGFDKFYKFKSIAIKFLPFLHKEPNLCIVVASKK